MKPSTNDIWVKKLRDFLTVLLIGFAAGSIVTNATYTYQLTKDCELMRQFRVNNVAYTCMVK